MSQHAKLVDQPPVIVYTNLGPVFGDLAEYAVRAITVATAKGRWIVANDRVIRMENAI